MPHSANDPDVDSPDDGKVDSFILAGDRPGDRDKIIIHAKDNSDAWIESDTTCADYVGSDPS